MINKVYSKKIAALKLIVYDFDGVMTNNKVYVNEKGEEQVCVHRGDGYAVQKIKDLNIDQIILSTEKNEVVGRRGEKLGVEVIQAIDDKRNALKKYCEEHNISLENVLYLGNDLNDFEVMQSVGLRGCPADAELEIRNICDWIASANGGQGVIRELYRVLERIYRDVESSRGNGDFLNNDVLAHISEGQVVAIIPARSGSKGIPDKNIKELKGIPLIAYTIAVAKLSTNISRIIVSTDSEEYAQIARKYGAEVPFIRPKDISSDSSTDFEFVSHAIYWMYENEGTIPEYFVHLRATSPIRVPSVIDEAIAKIMNHNEATSLRSAIEEKSVITPYKWFNLNGDYYESIFFDNNEKANLPRQSYPKVYMPSSYVDIIKTKTVLERGVLHGDKILAFESPETIDIDELSDFQKAEKSITEENILYSYLKNY